MFGLSFLVPRDAHVGGPERLLDEPTLGLDPESERMLAERLPKLMGSSDVLIMTTHSPIMLATVQRIIALDGGRVVADGPREKLLKIS